jgi:hypothetical protein
MAGTKKRRPRALKTVALAWSLWRWLPASQRRQVYLLLARQGAPIVLRELNRRKRRRR